MDERFSRLVADRGPALLAEARALVGAAHAEDLVQEAFVRVAARWESVQDPEAYLRVTLARLAISRWRRTGRRPEVLVAEVPEQPFDDPGFSPEVWAAVRTLPPRQRAVIVLRQVQDLSEAETAARLGITVGTVKSTQHKALAALRAQLGEVTA